MKEEVTKQPLTLPRPLRKKLERMAKAQHCTMNAVIVRLIDEAPEPAALKKTIQEQ